MVGHRRRVIQLGQKTLVLSIPTRWARRWNIVKGNDLDVEELGYRLLVKTSGADAAKTRAVQLQLEGTDRSLFWIAVSATYRAGYDDLVVHPNPRVLDTATQKLV